MGRVHSWLLRAPQGPIGSSTAAKLLLKATGCLVWHLGDCCTHIAANIACRVGGAAVAGSAAICSRPDTPSILQDVAWHTKHVTVFGSVGDDRRLIIWDTRSRGQHLCMQWWWAASCIHRNAQLPSKAAWTSRQWLGSTWGGNRLQTCHKEATCASHSPLDRLAALCSQLLHSSGCVIKGQHRAACIQCCKTIHVYRLSGDWTS